MINHRGTQTIETERLILRKIEMSDAEEMYNNWANDPEVPKFMRWQAHESVEVTKKIIKEWLNGYNSLKTYHWGIVLKDGNILIGNLSAINMNEDDMRCEAGYCIGRKWWNNGYTSEALRAVIEYMINGVGFNRVEAYHSVKNPASGKVMAKAGMRKEGSARQYYNAGNKLQDSAFYGIIREDL